jgi:hypothetical protein
LSVVQIWIFRRGYSVKYCEQFYEIWRDEKSIGQSAIPSPYEIIARTKKATALVNLLAAYFTAAEVALFTPENWLMAAKAAQVKPPSVETQAEVLEMLRARERKV